MGVALSLKLLQRDFAWVSRVVRPIGCYSIFHSPDVDTARDGSLYEKIIVI